jgi:hypothetical protein
MQPDRSLEDLLPEEILDRLEPQLAAIEEEFNALLRVLRYAEDLTVVHKAAQAALEATAA